MTGRHGKPRWRVLALAGVLLIAIGTAVLAHIGFYLHHSSSAAASLQKEARAAVARAVAPDGKCFAPPPSKMAGSGARLVLDVPALTLSAPVVASTDDAALAEAVGHLATSSWPDQGGTVVLEAHDVTFFRNLGELKTNDRIILTASCRRWTYTVANGSVVKAGTPVRQTARPRLVLVTCWPTNALYLTDKRYMVVANLISANSAASVLPDPDGQAGESATAFQPALPAGVTSDEVTADAVRVPLGRLTVDSAMSRRWQASPLPLQAAHAATQVFGAALLALRAGHDDWWTTIGPNVPANAGALLRGRTLRWQGLVDVAEFGSGQTLARIRVSGNAIAGNRAYRVTVDVTVHQGYLVISHWSTVPR
jgi:LPXTG-site transpeptidase (sortase) family protein